MRLFVLVNDYAEARVALLWVVFASVCTVSRYAALSREEGRHGKQDVLINGRLPAVNRSSLLRPHPPRMMTFAQGTSAPVMLTMVKCCCGCSVGIILCIMLLWLQFGHHLWHKVFLLQFWPHDRKHKPKLLNVLWLQVFSFVRNKAG